MLPYRRSRCCSHTAHKSQGDSEGVTMKAPAHSSMLAHSKKPYFHGMRKLQRMKKQVTASLYMPLFTIGSHDIETHRLFDARMQRSQQNNNPLHFLSLFCCNTCFGFGRNSTTTPFRITCVPFHVLICPLLCPALY